MPERIYLDNHATTRVDPRVVEAMLPYFTERYGNPASRSHRFGWEAEEAVEEARARVAELVGARPAEMLFTSGATEANNLALRGVYARLPAGRRHVLSTAIEHRAALDPLRRLQREGAEVTLAPVDPSGVLDPAALASLSRADTGLVSVMAANNEVGTIQPLAEIARRVRERSPQAILHTDAAQAAGKVPFPVKELGVDLASLSAHKMYGPKGVGALYIRRGTPRVRVEPLLEGGGQERGLRPGTLPVPLVVGFGVAAAIARREMDEEARRTGALRDRLLGGLRARLDGLQVNGDLERRLPGNLNLSFAGVAGEALLVGLKDLAVSSGSACTSGSLEPSHVLAAIGVKGELAHGALRFGVGRFNTDADIDRAVELVVAVVRRLRAISPLGAWR